MDNSLVIGVPSSMILSKNLVPHSPFNETMKAALGDFIKYQNVPAGGQTYGSEKGSYLYR